MPDLGLNKFDYVEVDPRYRHKWERGGDLDKEAVIRATSSHAKDPFCRSQEVGKKGNHTFCRLLGQLQIQEI